LQVLHPFDVRFDPSLDVCVFCDLHRRSSVTRLNFADTAPVKLGEEWSHVDGMKLALKSAPSTPVRFRTGKFGQLMGKFHRQTRSKAPNTNIQAPVPQWRDQSTKLKQEHAFFPSFKLGASLEVGGWNLELPLPLLTKKAATTVSDRRRAVPINPDYCFLASCISCIALCMS